MDYCSSCRRHLNGALVCPGCGAYAPDIAPAVADGAIGVAPAIRASWRAGTASQPPAWNAWHDGRPGDESAVGSGGMESAPSDDASGDLDGVAALPEGRAARRRQRARWKKNQRRAVVATAVALVGGGITLASMDRQSGDRTQAAAAPKDPGMGTLEEQTLRDSHPTLTEPDKSSSPTPTAQPSPPGLSRGQYSTDSLRTTPSARPDAAAAPRTVAGSNPQPKATARSSGTTASDRTDPANTTVTQPTQTPAPATTGGTSGSGGDGGTGDTGANSGTSGTSSGTSQTATSPTSPTTTSPTQICLLVVCIG